MLPSIFGENLFDDFFTAPFGMMMPQGRDPLYGKHGKNIMKTDVRETENSYELDIDLPGFKKDEVQVDLKDGYLTIQAAKGVDKDEGEQNGKYIRQERYAGACSRSFYVGEALQPEESVNSPSPSGRPETSEPVYVPSSTRPKSAARQGTFSPSPSRRRSAVSVPSKRQPSPCTAPV